MRMNMFHSKARGVQGFSLIDVMIAVLVLATGMLALAALQGGLVRSSAETRSRSQAAAIAEGALGAVRAESDDNSAWYDTLTGWDDPDETDPTGTWASQLADSGITTPMVGVYGENFTVDAHVARMAPSRDTGVCGAANVPCFVLLGEGEDAEVVATGDRRIGEYKRIETIVRWTDAAGETHEIRMSDVISSLPSANSEQLVNRELDAAKRRLGGPKVRIPIPDDAGIIPIAIGDGRDTAATNPKPVLDTSFGTQDTKFDVLTYAAADGAAEVQRRIETQAIACRCRFGAPLDIPSTDTFFTTKVRPTIWNGTRYATPKTAESEGITVNDAWGSDSASQSPLCDDCCRDHHDPTGLGDKPKFSPYRAEHKHFRFASGAWTEITPATASSPEYFEACRMIRVDGIWRVSSDARLEHMSLLETKNFARSFIPSDVGDPSAQDRYENFVKEYLDDRVIPVLTGGTPNVAALELANLINYPATILLQPTTVDKRFLHNRALYLDYLEPSARNFLASKMVNCTSTPAVLCLLPFLPFVSINTTEIAAWSVLARDAGLGTPKIAVSNVGGTFGAPNGEPRRGKVTVTTNSVTTGEVDRVQLSMDRGNAGLNGSSAITEAEALDANRFQDRQTFRFEEGAFTDLDNDGTPDSVDNCPGIANDQSDRDGDGRGDACDDDDDGDAVLDTVDNCPLIANPEQEDTDFDTGADPDGDGVRGDGIGDACDPSKDNDEDEILDGDDNCPMVANPDQKDSNENGIGDECDRDFDEDGVQDKFDNCPAVPNGPLKGDDDQLDDDGDGIGNACDTIVNTKVTFNVTLAITGEDLALYEPRPLVGWAVNATPTTCEGTYSPQGTDTNPNPYVCKDALGPSLDLLVGQYNRIITTTLKPGFNNPCPDGKGKITEKKICQNYRLSAVSVNGTAVTPFSPDVTRLDKVGEESRLNLPNVPAAANVSATLTAETPVDLSTLEENVGYICSAGGNYTYNTAYCQ
jgi:type II secretory pathway pseudopilin PulG